MKKNVKQKLIFKYFNDFPPLMRRFVLILTIVLGISLLALLTEAQHEQHRYTSSYYSPRYRDGNAYYDQNRYSYDTYSSYPTNEYYPRYSRYQPSYYSYGWGHHCGW